MDVHPPHEPIHSVRDFFLHLFTITIGLLIALSLEALVEHIHNRHNIHEAQANLLSEIHENRTEIEDVLPFYPRQQQQIAILLNVLAEKDPATHTGVSGSVGFNGATLSQDSYATAQIDGALALMDYGQTKRYASIYTLQTEFVTAQRSTFQLDAAPVMGTFFAQGQHSFDNFTPHDRELLADRLRVYSGNLTILNAIATQLDQEYKKF
jgi:hypothetical protein